MGFVYHALPDIKRIHVYVNGDAYHAAANVIVHPRRIRNYDIFLKDLTEKLRPSYGAVRNVYTPVNGSRVRDLEDLENHQRYVAAGRERFRKLQYVNIEEMQAKKKPVKAPAPKPSHDVPKFKRPFRKRPYNWEPINIHVYRNGDDVSPAKKISLIQSDLEDWDKLLIKIGDKLSEKGAIRKLYSLNGDWVRSPTGIKNGQRYVAVASYEQFKKVMYGEIIDRLPKEFLKDVGSNMKQNQTSKSTIPLVKKGLSTIKLPTFIKKPIMVKKDDISQKKDAVSNKKQLGPTGNKAKSVSILTKPAVQYIKKANTLPNHKPKPPAPVKTAYVRNPKPTAKEMNEIEKKKKAALHKANEKFTKDGKSPDSEDSAYLSGTEHRRTKKQTNGSVHKEGESRYFAPSKKVQPKKVASVDYDEDSGGIYRARTHHKDAKHAKEVRELKHLPVELPIDEVEATEIGDEVLSRHEEVTEDDNSEEEYHIKRLHKLDSSDKDSSSRDSDEIQSPKHKPIHENNYPLTYNHELPNEARTA